EEVEVHVGGRVEGVGELVEVELEQARADALDLDAAGEVAAEGTAVELLELIDAIADDVPAEHLLIDVAEQDTGGELGEVRVLLHEGLGVEDDRLLEVVEGDVGVERAAQLHLDLGAGEAE